MRPCADHVFPFPCYALCLEYPRAVLWCSQDTARLIGNTLGLSPVGGMAPVVPSTLCDRFKAISSLQPDMEKLALLNAVRSYIPRKRGPGKWRFQYVKRADTVCHICLRSVCDVLHGPAGDPSFVLLGGRISLARSPAASGALPEYLLPTEGRPYILAETITRGRRCPGVLSWPFQGDLHYLSLLRKSTEQ